MRARVNHKEIVKKTFVDKNFWKEFNKRGFKIDNKNDGYYYAEAKKAKMSIQLNKLTFVYDEKTSFNIVSADNFMKTINHIEGMVKYKLFK